jgi:diguanylate cyclase (GGDEF)-like protein
MFRLLYKLKEDISRQWLRQGSNDEPSGGRHGPNPAIRRLIVAGIVCGIPLATLVFCTIYHFSESYQRPEFAGWFPPLVTTFGSLTAAYALTLAAFVFLMHWRHTKMTDDMEEMRRAQKQMSDRANELQTRVEFFSAEREVALVLKEDVEFETILKKVLQIAAELLSGCGVHGAHEINILVRDETTGKLQARAQRKGGETLFDRNIVMNPADMQMANESFEQKRLLRRTGPDELDVALPFAADGEVVGVMKVRTPLEGDFNERAALSEMLEKYLGEMINIVAVAIKTPDLYTRTIRDGLTGLFTKRHFMNQLENYSVISRRHGEPLCLIMVDIDHFKKINDTYGHLSGDTVLKGVAHVIMENIRSYSSAYRYGGEEMGVILPKTKLAQAAGVAERLRKKIEAKKFQGENRTQIRVTISLGVAEFTDSMKEVREMIGAADEALYEAKHSGRNRVCTRGNLEAAAAGDMPAEPAVQPAPPQANPHPAADGPEAPGTEEPSDER